MDPVVMFVDPLPCNNSPKKLIVNSFDNLKIATLIATFNDDINQF